MKKRSVLLIGKRKSVLTRLASELQKEGLSVQWTNNYATAHTDFRPNRFDLIIFGRGVDDRNRLRLQTIYQARNPEIIFLEGIAPIIPLLVHQIRYALLRKKQNERTLAEARR
jgi:DNA-binding response OmpR family regulator